MMRSAGVSCPLSGRFDSSSPHCSGQLQQCRSGLTLKELLPGLKLKALLLNCCCSGLKIVLRLAGWRSCCLSCFHCRSVPQGTSWPEGAAKLAIAFSYQRTSKGFLHNNFSNRWRFFAGERAPNDARADGYQSYCTSGRPE